MKNNPICSLGKQLICPLGKSKLKTQRYHYTTIRMTNIFKIIKIPNSGKHMEKLDLSYISSTNIQPLWKTAWQFLLKLNMLTI